MGLRVYRCGKIERKFKSGIWREVKNVDNNKGYNTVRVDDKNWFRHRIVVAAFNTEFDINNTDHQIDHIDGNPLNNAFNNLRVVSNQGNQFNTKAKGYYWDKEMGKWRSKIKINKISKHLGYFDTEEESRAAYLTAKAELHVIAEIC